MSRRSDKRRAPLRLAVDRFQHGGEELVVLSFPLPRHAALDQLTEAEHAVARGLLAGQTTAAIAAARGRSPRTVANQVARLFRKLGVRSRAELLARLGDQRPSRR